MGSEKNEKGNKEHHNDDETCFEAFLESLFHQVGLAVAYNPWRCIVATLVITCAFGYGFSMLQTESRPDKLWIPSSAPALAHNDYVKVNWPSQQRFDLWIATCKDKDTSTCNLLDPLYVKELSRLRNEVVNLVIDGNKIVDEWEAAQGVKPDGEGAYLIGRVSYQTLPWTKYRGNWSFIGPKSENSTTPTAQWEKDIQKKCFEFGPFCGEQSMLDVYGNDEAIISSLSLEGSLLAVNSWDNQGTACPLTLARSSSPCHLPVCKSYKGTEERKACRANATTYCDQYCPVDRRMQYIGTCQDSGCDQIRGFQSFEASNANSATGNNSIPNLSFETPKIDSMIYVPADGRAGGEIKRATHALGFWAIAEDSFDWKGDTIDPVAEEWEKQALCVLGITAGRPGPNDPPCPGSDKIEFRAQFSRSLSDEFTQSIRGDLVPLNVSLLLIVIYMIIMLSRMDAVHSMIGMSFVTVFVVGFSYACANGSAAYTNQYNNSLVNTLIFLLLGLGVDDAFVLAGEFRLATKLHPELSIEERVALACKTGGISILITSVTDALAFFVGAFTVIPALSWFCVFAGFGVTFCFLFQMIFFLPCLVIDQRRAAFGFYDFCCCIARVSDELNPQYSRGIKCGCAPCCSEVPEVESGEKDIGENKFIIDHFHRGCCCEFCCTDEDAIPTQEARFGQFGEVVLSTQGQVFTLLLFAAIMAGGVLGSFSIIKDFKIEWFINDGTPLREFYSWNELYFASGQGITIYTPDTTDYFAQQDAFNAMQTYLNETSPFTDKGESINNWHHAFRDFIDSGTQEANANLAVWLTADGKTFKDRTVFFRELHNWYKGGGGSRYRSNMRWRDPGCENNTLHSVDMMSQTVLRGWDVNCSYADGLRITRLQATLTLASTNTGQGRYDTMTKLRTDISDIISGAFPLSFQFLYWEEVGVTDVELMRNLVICGIVILTIIGLLIPKPGVAFWVIFCVLLSVVNTLGFLHWWGITISVVSSVYILISVGLAVDYSAHIAHVFVISTGSAKERAIKALMRIGPSVFNAVASTFIAVVCLSFSKSYVFRVFFKALALVTVIGGVHGLWLLPVLLSIFGGDKPDPGSDSPRDSQIMPAERRKGDDVQGSNGESKEEESKSADPAEIEMAEVRRRQQSVHV